MTQNNERELLVKIKYAICMAIYSDDGLDGLEGENLMKEIDKYLSPISQNEHQEAVGFIDEADEGIFGDVQNGIAEGLCKVGDLLYTSPPKQIPDGWKLDSNKIRATAMGMLNGNAEQAKVIDTVIHIIREMINTSPTTSLTSETNTEVWE